MSWDIDKIKFNVDNLIERRLGGKRNGLKIRWRVPEGIYEFDPRDRKLYEVSDSEVIVIQRLFYFERKWQG